MRKKGFETDLTISILLTVPEIGQHRLIAEKYLKQNFPNYQLIFFNEQEENLPIALVRDLITQTSFGRTGAEKTVYILCGADKASLPAQNALLKILEEPPENILLVLVATAGHQLLPTITSRCQEINLSQEPSADRASAGHVTATLEFCLKPTDTKFHQLIELAENWQKDEQREKNLNLVLTQLLTHKNSSLALGAIREALESWKKNGNVKLVIEHCLFTIKKHYLNKLSISKR